MRFITRIKVFATTLLVCMMMVVSMAAFTGTASAASVVAHNHHPNRPTLTCTPHRVFPDPSGTGHVGLNGQHFTPFATVIIQPQNQAPATTTTDAGGNFSFSANLITNQGRSVRITALDQTTSRSASCTVFFV